MNKKKLTLRKVSVARLDEGDLQTLNGGKTTLWTVWWTCPECYVTKTNCATICQPWNCQTHNC